MKKILSLLAVMLMMAACSPFALVNSEVYNNADLAQYRTFRIVTPDMGKLPPGMQMVTYYNIAAAIRQEILFQCTGYYGHLPRGGSHNGFCEYRHKSAALLGVCGHNHGWRWRIPQYRG